MSRGLQRVGPQRRRTPDGDSLPPGVNLPLLHSRVAERRVGVHCRRSGGPVSPSDESLSVGR